MHQVARQTTTTRRRRASSMTPMTQTKEQVTATSPAGDVRITLNTGTDQHPKETKRKYHQP